MAETLKKPLRSLVSRSVMLENATINGIESPFMPYALKAIYRNGAFILQTSCNLPEGAEVELLIQSPQVVSPPISDSETKQRFLKSLVERMQQNPIPLNAPHFTREMLHKRR